MHKPTPPLHTDNHIRPSLGNSIRYYSVIVKSDTALLLGRAAHLAAEAEILTQPKPGLVDPTGPGCHKDMDWKTLMTSAKALAPFWHKQALTGLDGTPPADAMVKLRGVGLEMDAAMFAATNGINAHKGLVYIMSLLLYGVGRAIYKSQEPSAPAITKFAADAVKGSVEKELLPLKNRSFKRKLTNGERLFLEYGVTGVRGEAENGFPSITGSGLPELERALREGACENDAALCALLAIMETNEDSNVIHRGGYDFWKNDYKKMTAEARLAFRPNSGDYTPITGLEEKFMPLGISPGGAADLLACTLFLHYVTFSACQH